MICQLICILFSIVTPQVIFMARNGVLTVDGVDVTLPIQDPDFKLKRVCRNIVRVTLFSKPGCSMLPHLFQKQILYGVLVSLFTKCS